METLEEQALATAVACFAICAALAETHPDKVALLIQIDRMADIGKAMFLNSTRREEMLERFEKMISMFKASIAHSAQSRSGTIPPTS